MAARLEDIVTFPSSNATQSRTAPTTTDRLDPGDFAVVVNANARGYQRARRRGLFDGIRREDLYESHSLAESELHVRSIVERGYSTVVAAGGDGTVSQLLNDLRAVVPNPHRQPRVGIVRMGTGNALASHVGVDRAEADLARLSSGCQVSSVPLQMIECEGQLAPFAGCGADASVLNDYIQLKEKVAGTKLARLMTGVRGYLVSGVLKTAPGLLSSANKRRVFVINEAPLAYAVDGRGNVLETYRRGDVLYHGDAAMAAVGAIPYYGYEMKMFPAANRMPGAFQVRVARMNPLMAVARLGQVWRGTIGREHGMYDFLTSRVRFEFDGDVPFHLSGDAAGYRRELLFKTASRRFECVRPVDTISKLRFG